MKKVKRLLIQIKGKLKIQKKDITIFFFAFAFGLFVAAFRSDPALATAFLAIATIAMVFITYWSIASSNRRERQRRDDEQNKEERAINERHLNEIAEWAREGIRLCALHHIRTKNVMKDTKYKRIADLFALNSTKDSIVVLGKGLDNKLNSEVKLKPKIKKAINKLEVYLGGLKGIGIVDLGGDFEGEEILTVDPQLLKDLNKAFEGVLKTIADNKSKLIS